MIHAPWGLVQGSFKAQSNKTRIETVFALLVDRVEIRASKRNPIKQGLKRKRGDNPSEVITQASKRNPIKQGLKPRSGSSPRPTFHRFKAQSNKTRIETTKAIL